MEGDRMSNEDTGNAGCDKCGTNDRYEDSKCCVACINQEHGIMYDALVELQEVLGSCNCEKPNKDRCAFDAVTEALGEIK